VWKVSVFVERIDFVGVLFHDQLILLLLLLPIALRPFQFGLGFLDYLILVAVYFYVHGCLIVHFRTFSTWLY
jgi:hypothetical protein